MIYSARYKLISHFTVPWFTIFLQKLNNHPTDNETITNCNKCILKETASGGLPQQLLTWFFLSIITHLSIISEFGKIFCIIKSVHKLIWILLIPWECISDWMTRCSLAVEVFPGQNWDSFRSSWDSIFTESSWLGV